MKMNRLRFQSKILCLCVSLLFTGSVWAQTLLRGGSGGDLLSGEVLITAEEFILNNPSSSTGMPISTSTDIDIRL